MRYFFNGVLIGLVLIGFILTAIRGLWWLMPAAILFGWLLDYVGRAILGMNKRQ
jgi:hypothetical protein